MAYFPFFIDIKGKKGLIVGGGKVSERKIEKLLPFSPLLTVISPFFTQSIKNNSVLNLISRSYIEGDEEGYSFVIASTSDREVNKIISKRCQERNILINVVDDPSLCSFLFPCLIKNGKLSIGISTSGSSPTACIEMKERINSLIPSDFDSILDFLYEKREEIKKSVPNEKERHEILKELFCKAMDKKSIPQNVNDKGKVYIIGAGCGQWDLITVRGMEKIKESDVIIYDDLIDEHLLSLNKNAELIYMGKRKGSHYSNQDEINNLLYKKAKEGKIVSRLKGGDPFVFGRGKEEILFLEEGGIECEYIPGISSCIALPGINGIPLTMRKESRGFMVVTGHQIDERDEDELFSSMAIFPGTIVVLMGLTRIEKITKLLIEKGKNENEKVCVISSGSSIRLDGNLLNIAEKVKKTGVKTPAVIVIGKTVEYKEA